MNEFNLSNRLKTVVQFIPEGSIVADIGSDHAYLPCYAVLHRIAKKAIAGEVNEGPYQSATKQVQQLQLTSSISVRKGDGLAVLKKDEVDVITIAGMGGCLIAKILEEGKDKLGAINRLILQPNNSSEAVRKWLIDHHFELIQEVIIEEDDKIYEVLVAKKGDPHLPYKEVGEIGILLGPFLMKEKNRTFRKKWNGEIQKWAAVLEQLTHAEDYEKVIHKKETIMRLKEQVSEVLKS